MRIAILSDIHGNLTAFEAAAADLRKTSPDLVLHGGDLADGGSSPAEIVDRVRDLGWQGVAGNGEEALCNPETLEVFASQSKAPASLWAAVRETMAAARDLLGEERIAWLRGLPDRLFEESLALAHASPGDAWRSPGPAASDAELLATYGPLGRPLAVYGHIHQAFVRTIPLEGGGEFQVANAGSVSLSYDGDSRASYLLVDGLCPQIRRVEYDVERELRLLKAGNLPHKEWIGNMLVSAAPKIP
jgi:predicted phosphodiesterase